MSMRQQNGSHFFRGASTHSMCVCLLRCDKTHDDVLFGVQLNVSSYSDVAIYLSLTVGCIVFHSHGGVSRRVDMIMAIRIILITI